MVIMIAVGKVVKLEDGYKIASGIALILWDGDRFYENSVAG